MNPSDNRTVGERLREAREALGLELADAAKVTSIKFHHLQDLENDHPEVFSSGVQARGFLRLYAAFLKLDAGELISIWDSPPEREPPAITALVDNVWSPENFDEIKTTDGLNKQRELSVDATEDLSSSVGDVEVLEKNSKKTADENRQIPLLKNFFSHIHLPEKIKQFISQILIPESAENVLGKIKSVLRRKQEKDVEHETQQESSGEIFKEIGAAMRDRRIAMDLNLSDIEHFTNLKRMVLVAIEDGRFNDLPSTVQGRGMLNNYAQFLAMEDSAIMDRYARALQLQREELMPAIKAPQPGVSVKVNLPEGLRKIINPDLVIGGALILALFGFILWGASQMLGSGRGQATEAPSISEMLQLTPSVSPTVDLIGTSQVETPSQAITEVPGVVAAESTPTPVATVNAAPLQLYIVANDRAFLRVVIDGVSAFDGRVVPSNVYTYSGNELITLLTGNGEALEVYFNQEYLGKLGEVGEVVNLRFSLQGLQTPTPDAQLTPTATLPVEAEGIPAEGN